MMNISASLKPRQQLFSNAPIPLGRKAIFTVRMDIRHIRRANMLTLIKREPSKAAFARKVETDPAYVSQILSTKTKAEIGNTLARAIEQAYKLPNGWMDREHEQQEVTVEHEFDALTEAWVQLLPEEQRELFADIQKRAAHNKAVMERFSGTPPDNNKSSGPNRRSGTVLWGYPGLPERRKKEQ